MSLAVMLFLLTGCVGANATTIEDVTRPFVSSLNAGDAAAARAVMSPAAVKLIDEADLSKGLQDLLNSPTIKGYKSLRVCEFGVGNLGGVSVLTGQGLITTASGPVRFESALQKDPDGAWRIRGFFLRPEQDNQAWGACR